MQNIIAVVDVCKYRRVFADITMFALLAYLYLGIFKCSHLKVPKMVVYYVKQQETNIFHSV